MSIHAVHRSVGVLFLLGGAFAGAAAGQAVEPQVVEMELVASSSLDLGFGTCQWLYPLDEPAEELGEEPRYRSERIVRYSARFGDSEDDRFAFVLDESGGTGTGYDTVYADVNNDDRLEAESERFTLSLSTRTVDRPCRIALQVTTGGRTAPYHVDFSAFPYSSDDDMEERDKPIHANLRDSSYYAGRVVLGGKERGIAIADLDSNGRFDDPEETLFQGDRVFLDWDGDGEFDNEEETDGYNGYPYGRYTRIHGRWYSIVARADGGRLEITEAKPALGKVTAAPMVVSADLRSADQPCFVDLAAKEPRAVVGTYALRGLVLGATDEDGKEWKVSATFAADVAPEVTVTGDGTLLLPAGPPLRIVPTVTAASGARELSFELAITGRAGEVYRWPSQNPAPEQPGFAIVDAAGKLIHTDRFEYG